MSTKARTATERGTGIIHYLAAAPPAQALCGKDARDWSTEVTLMQELGLTAWCTDCTAALRKEEES